MLSLVMSIILLGASPTDIKFDRPRPGITQNYRGDYYEVWRAMDWDFHNRKYPGLAFFKESHDFSIRPYKIRITLLAQMPHWVDKSKRPKEEQTYWDSMYKIMWEHEQIHLDIYQEAFNRAALALDGKNPWQAEQIFQKFIKEGIAVNEEYDILSNHSRRQNRYTELEANGTLARKYSRLLEIRAEKRAQELKYFF